MAFETLFYVNSITGNDTTGDGISIPVATAAKASTLINADAARNEKYTIIVETDLINDVFNFVDTPNLFKTWIKIVYANGVKHYSNTSQLCAVINNGGSGSAGGALWVVGAKISGFTYSISDGAITNFTTQYRQPLGILENCDLEGYVHLPRMASYKLNTCRIRTGIVHSTNGSLASWCLTNSRNCDFRGANQFKNTGTISVPIWTVEEWRLNSDTGIAAYEGWQAICARNDFDSVGNITIALRVGQTYGASATAQQYYFMSNNFNGCNVNFTTNILTIPATWAAATDAATMRAKALTDGLTLASNWFEYERFSAITYDSFDFPATPAEILKRHIGANRYAITQTVPIANSDYTDASGVYESNKVSPTPLVYEMSAIRAAKLRRAILHFTRSGNTEQLGTDGEVEILIETSTDGTNFTTLGTFLSGIDSTTLDFDYILEVAKSVRFSIQPTGAAFGEVKFYGVTGEFLTLEDQLNQSFSRIFVEQKGNNLLAETPVKYLVNPLNSNYKYYNPIRIASQVIDQINEFNNTYALTADELISRANNINNPALASDFGHLEIIYKDSDPITNPYNIEGYSIVTSEGLVVVKLKQ